MYCRSNTLLLVICLSLPAFLPTVRGQPAEIDGCPMYGCRPSGSFSFEQEVPRGNVTIGWTTGNFQGPVPDFGGCAGNGASLVCQSNGPGPGYTGYMVLDLGSGEVLWRDLVLRLPTLPLVGTDGSFWGTDGGNLMLYSADGTPLLPEMHLDPNMRPLFGMQFVDVGYGAVLLVSQQTGELITTFTDGLPLANMFLNDTVQGVSGNLLPVAPAVTSKNRIYVLTEFAPDEKQRDDVSILGLQRLYAIDTSTSVGERMKIVWHANFENELPSSGVLDASLRFGSESYARRLTSKLRDPSVPKPSILWNAGRETIYVALPPPMLPGSRLQGGDRLFAIQDTGKDGSMVFQAQINVKNMLMYDGSADRNPRNAVPQLWVSAPDGRLLAIDKTGVIAHVLDMPAILKTNFTVTSKITTARGRGVDEDFLLFGINVQQPTAAFESLLSSYGVEVFGETPANYVIGVDTPENIKGMPLAWILPTPEDTVVFGQIIGIKGDGSSIPDQLIVYSQIEHKFAKIFSIIAQK